MHIVITRTVSWGYLAGQCDSQYGGSASGAIPNMVVVLAVRKSCMCILSLLLP